MGPAGSSRRDGATGSRRLRVLHAIHDFLPRHQAGAEIYVHELCKALVPHADTTVVCAEYDSARAHGDLSWRAHGGVAVAEIVNNWVADAFDETYRSPIITQRLAEVLDAVQPDVLHVHSLFNLSFDLPALARSRGIPVAATLHDYTLVCASGGQRVHRAEAHRCDVIDAERCARCFQQSPWHAQRAIGTAAPQPAVVRAVAKVVRQRVPRVAEAIARSVGRLSVSPVTAGDLSNRLARAHEALSTVDLVVAPSSSIADEYRRLGARMARVCVSDYGFTTTLSPATRFDDRPHGPLRVGFVGTPVWHKGLHVAVDAIRLLEGEDCTFDIHGDMNIDPAYVATLRDRAVGLPVRWRGAFTRERLAEVYAAIDVLVVPSIWHENSPLVIHEAFMAGVVVVGSRIGGIPNLVRDGWNGWLFEPGSSAGLADILRRLTRERRLVPEAAARAPRVKTIAQDAEAWDARYRALLAGRGVLA